MRLSLPRPPSRTNHLFGQLCSEGSVIETGANHPFLLLNQHEVYLIVGGQVDVFAVRLVQGDPVGRRYLLSASTGEILVGAGKGDGAEPEALLAVASQGTAVRRVALSRLLSLTRESMQHEQAAHLLDRWLSLVSYGTAAGRSPRSGVELRCGEEMVLDAQSCVSGSGHPLWVEHAAGTSFLLGEADVALSGAHGLCFPLAGRAWLHCHTDVRMSCLDTASYLRRDPTASALPHFHRIILHALSIRRQRQDQAEAERLDALCRHDRETVSGSLLGLARVLDDHPQRADVGRPVERGEALQEACARIFAALGHSHDALPGPEALSRAGGRDPILVIARASRLRVRPVMLRGEWWRGDHGPLLGYLGEEQRPVALLPASARRYQMHDVAAGLAAPRPVTAKLAQSLLPIAHSFYRRLPDRPLGAMALLRFGLQGARRDLLMIFAMALLSGLLALGTPLCTGVLFDAVIPGSQRLQLLQICIGLLLCALATSLFDLASGFGIQRLDGKMSASLHAAIWDRLLDLPARFFRGYSGGDLALRANGIQSLSKSLATVVVSLLISGLLGLLNLSLLFYYDTSLALLALLLIAIAMIFAVLCGARMHRYQLPMATYTGLVDALTFQLLSGVAKLRIAAAEGRAFAHWTEVFGGMRRLSMKLRAPMQVWSSFYPICASILLYFMVPEAAPSTFSTGRFIAFAFAFGSALAITLSVCQAALGLFALRFTYSRMQPILDALPEVTQGKASPGELSGAIELSHVSFRYREDGPFILDDINLRVQPGEFIAITGSSGSGKSTLLRLLLGFEQPVKGRVYYSGQDLSGLDVREVRRQIGVVLQEGKLMADDIFNNIVGSSNRTREEALEAARMAGFDQDLADMPMGLHTLVSEGGSTLSGGQRQRLLIARALVHRPRILFFDEATSALDNQTQAVVSQSIEKLAVTRVVIAHRLSTIINADRIIVLAGGRVVQSGTYEELLRQPGPFAELARRQLVGSPETGTER